MRRTIQIVLPLALALFFIYAGGSKLLDPVEFGLSIERYQILDHPWTLAVALWLPWIECFAAGSLILKNWRQAGLLILLGLLMFFEIILVITWLRGLDINCGCIGGSMDSSVEFAFFRNIGLIVLSLVVYTTYRKENEGTQ